jgi:hypothetical protein
MTSTVTILAAALSLSACGLFGAGGASKGPPGPPPANTGTTRTEAYAASAADRCEQTVAEAEQKLGKALQLAQQDPGGDLLQKIRKLKIDVDLSPAEAPDGTVAHSILIVRDSLGDEARDFMEHPPRTAAQKKKLQRYSQKATKGVQLINTFRQQVTEIGITFLDANFAAQSCHTSAVQMAAFVERMQVYGTGVTRPNVELERAALGRLVAASHRADALASATMGLVATYQATVGDGKDAQIIDAAVADVAAALGEPGESDDGLQEAESLLAAAKVDLEAVAADPAIKAQLEQPSTAAAPSGALTPTLVVRADRVEKAKAVLNAATAAAAGNWGGAVSSAAALLPEDSALHHTMAGAGAIMSGNYLGAVEAAVKLARSRPRLASAMDRLRNRLG